MPAEGRLTVKKTRKQQRDLIDLMVRASIAMGGRKEIPAGANCTNCGNQFCWEKGISMANECKADGFLYWESVIWKSTIILK